jgi:hypothetical protein
MENYPMANEFKPDYFNAAQSVLMDLKAKAADAEKRGDTHTFALMNHLVKVVSPIVNKAHARLLREEKAEMNRRHQKLKENSHSKVPFKRED